MAQDPLLVENSHNDSFENEEAFHLPLWQEQRGGNEADSASSSGSVSSALLTDARSNQEAPLSPKLPWAFLLSYAIGGLTLSLPTLPMMYILNTKVTLPLSVLPAYGAMSFMPYSFKPAYAYISSFFPRLPLLQIGWATCALTSLAWMRVSSVPLVFLVGITSSIAMSWSSFLLGLTLIDTARALSFPSAPRTSSNASFETAGSLFQSQAATARNIGSFTASILTCVIFGMNHSHETPFPDEVINGIFLFTAGCHVVSFLLVVWCRSSFEPFIQLKHTTNTEEDQSRRHSYAALEIVSTEEESTESNTDDDEVRPPQSTRWNLNVVVIVGLQILVIILATKKQVLQLLHQYTLIVPVFAIICILLTAFMLLRLYFSGMNIGAWIRHELGKSFGRSHVVGLVLILRHAVPSPSSILYSFLYQCFQAQPVWLQVFSLVDNGTVTLASWSYQKLWAPHYCHGRKLITFMMITTVTAQSLGTLYAALVHYRGKDEGLTIKHLFPWLVLGIKALTTFASEWNFLPSVVLATVSVKEPSATNWSVDVGVDAALIQGAGSEEGGGPQQQNMKMKPALSTNVLFGTLISCIDFGDQLGAIVSAPLVALLGITRDNNFNNLDTMIFICCGLGVLSTAFLLLLYW